MTRIKRALPMALIFVALSAINIFGASNLILTASSTSGSPGVTYQVYTDVTRTGETTAEVKYTIKATPNGNDDCTGITGYLSVGNDRRAISLKSASTTWYSGNTYTSSGSYTITVKPKDSTLATAFEASGSGSWVESYDEKVWYTYYTYGTRDVGYYTYKWRVYFFKPSGGAGGHGKNVYVRAANETNAMGNAREKRQDLIKKGYAPQYAANAGEAKFHKTRTETYVTGGPYKDYYYVTKYRTHYTCTGTMVKRSGYDVGIDKWYYVTYDASGGTGAPAKTGKIGRNPIEIEDYPETMQLVGHHFKNFGTNSSPLYKWEIGGTGTALDGTYFTPGDYYSGESDIILYAVWDIDTYDIKFDLNKNTPIEEGIYPEDTTFDFNVKKKIWNEAFEIPSQKPTSTNAVFDCWNTEPDGSGTSYEAGESIPSDLNYPQTLYAIWWKISNDEIYDDEGVRYVNDRYVNEYNTLSKDSKWYKNTTLYNLLKNTLKKNAPKRTYNKYKAQTS